METDISSLDSVTLEKMLQIRKEIEGKQEALRNLMLGKTEFGTQLSQGQTNGQPVKRGRGRPPGTKVTLSEESREKIRQGQFKRWRAQKKAMKLLAQQTGAAKPKTKKRAVKKPTTPAPATPSVAQTATA